MHRVGHVGIEAEQRGPHQDGAGLNQDITRQSVAPFEKDKKPAGSDCETDINESRLLGVDAENGRYARDPRHQPARPPETADHGGEETGQERSHESVHQIGGEFAEDDWIQGDERRNDESDPAAATELERHREHGEGRRGERDPWRRLRPLDVVRRLEQRERHIPRSLGIVAHPRFEIGREAVQRIAQRIPAVRHLIHRRLVIPLPVPAKVEEAAGEEQAGPDNGKRDDRRREAPPATQVLAAGYPVGGDQRTQQRRRRDERRNARAETKAKHDAEVRDSQKGQQDRRGRPADSRELAVQSTGFDFCGCLVLPQRQTVVPERSPIAGVVARGHSAIHGRSAKLSSARLQGRQSIFRLQRLAVDPFDITIVRLRPWIASQKTFVKSTRLARGRANGWSAAGRCPGSEPPTRGSPDIPRPAPATSSSGSPRRIA